MWFGIFFLLVGLSILLKAFFKIDIPVVRSVFALFIIYLGIKMLIGGFWCDRKDKNCEKEGVAAFSERNFKFDESKDAGRSEKEYSTVFGSSTVDLTDMTVESMKDKVVDVNTVFGETVVLLKREIPVKIRATAVFGEARLPNDNMVAFGTMSFEEPKEAPAKISIRGNVVFGSVKFQYKE